MDDVCIISYAISYLVNLNLKCQLTQWKNQSSNMINSFPH